MTQQLLSRSLFHHNNHQTNLASKPTTKRLQLYDYFLQKCYNLNTYNNTTQRQHMRRSQRVKNQYQKAYMQGKENSLGLYKKITSDYEEGDPLLTLGPNYIFFFTTFLIANLTSFILISKLANQQRFKPFYFLSIVILVYLDVVWLATALINPVTSEGDLCQQCMCQGREVTKAEGREHCSQCRVCIDQQVLRFRLVGACIGKHNFITFKLLLLGLFLWTLSLIMIIPQTFIII